jgi:beta-lactamase regulating signal transducer with metallopeptidase domain
MSERLFIEALAFVGDWALKATVLLFVALVITSVIRRSAAVRHLTWLTAFTGLLLIPSLTLLVPSYSVAVMRVTAPQARDSTPRQTRGAEDQRPVAATENETGSATDASPVMTSAGRGGSAEDTGAHGGRTLVLGGVFAVWLAGALAVALQAVIAFMAAGALRRRSVKGTPQPLDSTALCMRVGLGRRCEFRTSVTATPACAMTWGFVRPTVLLPRDSVSWSRERLEAVVLHELAHVRRRDSVSQILAFAACAVHWFNPVVWLCARAMRAEAERAADDAVLLAGVRPSTYAAELVRIAAERVPGRQPVATVGASIMTHAKIEARIKAIVEPLNRRRGVSSGEAMKAVGVGVGALLLLASVRVSISFADERHTAPATLASPLAQAWSARPDPTSARREDAYRRTSSNQKHRDRRGSRAISIAETGADVPRKPNVPTSDSIRGPGGLGDDTTAHRSSSDMTTSPDGMGRATGAHVFSSDSILGPDRIGDDTNAPRFSSDSMASPDMMDHTTGARVPSSDIRENPSVREGNTGPRTHSADARPGSESPDTVP